MQMAGLLTYFLFDSLPIPTCRDSGKGDRKVVKITAAGTVQDSHLIPYFDAGCSPASTIAAANL